jgi:hypothetical protein
MKFRHLEYFVAAAEELKLHPRRRSAARFSTVIWLPRIARGYLWGPPGNQREYPLQSFLNSSTSGNCEIDQLIPLELEPSLFT